MHGDRISGIGLEWFSGPKRGLWSVKIMAARDVLMKFLDCKNDCQCLLVDLCIIPLCGGRRSGCNADGSLSAVRGNAAPPGHRVRRHAPVPGVSSHHQRMPFRASVHCHEADWSSRWCRGSRTVAPVGQQAAVQTEQPKK